jgi:predicted nucleic acid-binding Zn ribbon protein
VFKGSGFYVNDYGKGSNGRSRSSSDDYSEKKDTSGSAKSDAKSESGAKAESKKEKVSSS